MKEISRTMMRNRCCCVVFDTELTPSQQKNLEISFSQEQSFKGSGKVQVLTIDSFRYIIESSQSTMAPSSNWYILYF